MIRSENGLADTRFGLHWLIKKHSYQTGDFLLASGKTSNYFLDLKKTLLLPEGLHYASELICHHLSKLMIDAVAGVVLGGCPLAIGVSLESHCACVGSYPALLIRTTAKDHGTKQLIEGYSEGKDVALLEDVITTGGSSIKALDILKEAGYNPTVLISVVDRLEGGAEAIKEAGFDIPYISLFTIKDIQGETNQ